MRSDLPPIKKHLFLTGEKQVGKSTLLRRLIEAKSLDCTGFETRAFYIDGERRGFTLHARADMPPHENDCICCVRIAERKSVPILPVFEENGVRILKNSLVSSSTFLLMDELGKLEKEASLFIAEVVSCLDSDKRVLGVLQKCSAAHIAAIAARDDVTVLEVTEENRDQLFDLLVKAF